MNGVEVEAYIARDNGDAPASRYGVKAWQWQPVAVAACLAMQEATGEELTPEAIDYIAGLVVSDHDDIEYIIREYGPAVGIDPADYLD